MSKYMDIYNKILNDYSALKCLVYVGLIFKNKLLLCKLTMT